MAGEDEAIGQNRTGLSVKQERVALLVAEDELTDEQIAEDAGVARSTLALWKLRPAIVVRVAEHVEAFKDRALSNGFADKRARIKELDAMGADLLAKLRKGDYEREDVKLSATGQQVKVWLVDNPTIAQVRGIFDDIAKEVGDRKQESVTKHTGSIAVEDARERLTDLVARHAAAATASGLARQPDASAG